MKRFDQILLIASFVAFSWLAMQAVHELGHVLGASATGGTVTKVALHPLALSRTDVSPNPHPLLVVWAGPIVGALVPLIVFLIAAVLRSRRKPEIARCPRGAQVCSQGRKPLGAWPQTRNRPMPQRGTGL